MAGEILVAKKTATIAWQNKVVTITAGETFARAGHPILDAYGAEFEPVFVHFDTEEPKTGIAGGLSMEVAGADGASVEPSESVAAPEPAPKDVRAWAAENDIEVPGRGKLPQEVIDQYKAATQGA